MSEDQKQSTASSTLIGTIREIATDGIRYWEPKRILYNLVLAVIVVFYFVRGWPGSLEVITLDFVLLLVLLAVLANVAYCAAYAVDVFAQLSGLRPLWQRIRWVVLVVGIIFAAIITRFWSIAIFFKHLF